MESINRNQHNVIDIHGVENTYNNIDNVVIKEKQLANVVYFPVGSIVNIKEHSTFFRAKRIIDIVFSSLALIILSPLFLFVAMAIRIDSKGKIIFAQLRTGKDGKPFTMYKFRSMYEDAEERHKELLALNEMDGPVFKIARDPRITRVGRFIRKSSIDELPQLINILKGEMSIVGPRPLAVYEAKKLNKHENMRHLIKPGLTCYWQISGRNDITFAKWIELDFKYIQKMSIWTDTKIVLRTIIVVLFRKGAY